MSGKKFDDGKFRMDLLPPQFMREVARVLAYGAEKYDEYNWLLGVQYNRLYAATLRHLLSWWEGEENDPESGLSHISHAACNLAFILQFIHQKRTELDNRPTNYKE